MSATTERAQSAANQLPARRRDRVQHGLKPLPAGVAWHPSMYGTHAAGTVHPGPRSA